MSSTATRPATATRSATAAIPASVAPEPVTTPSPLEIDLRPAPESRPTARRWMTADHPPAAQPATQPTANQPTANQPTLIDALHELLDEAAAPRPRGVRVHPDGVPGAIPPAPDLPEPTGWAAVLGMAIGQALIGARPVGQLQSWLDPAVLADLHRTVRGARRPDPRTVRSRPGPVTATAQVRVVSVRAQCPTPTAVETTIHLRLGGRSICLGARLEAHGRRWVCTDLAPGAAVLSALPYVRDTA